MPLPTSILILLLAADDTGMAQDITDRVCLVLQPVPQLIL